MISLDNVDFEKLTEHVKKFKLDHNNVSNEEHFRVLIAIVDFLGEAEYSSTMVDEIADVLEEFANG